VTCAHASIFENGVGNEAIVLQWPVQTTSWDFRVVRKWWAGECNMLLFCVKTIVSHRKAF